MSIKDGPSCPGCGLPNYEGLCPHCRADQDAYERELVPPFQTSIPTDEAEPTLTLADQHPGLRSGDLHHGLRYPNDDPNDDV
jgi:hypothetical protein